MDVNKLKEINNASTTEDLFGIEAPPDFQCPKIDDVLKIISEIERLSEIPRNCEEDDLKYNLERINYEVYGLDSKLEEIREAVDLVREWGKAWKTVVKDVIESDESICECYGIETK